METLSKNIFKQSEQIENAMIDFKVNQYVNIKPKKQIIREREYLKMETLKMPDLKNPRYIYLNTDKKLNFFKNI